MQITFTGLKHFDLFTSSSNQLKENGVSPARTAPLNVQTQRSSDIPPNPQIKATSGGITSKTTSEGITDSVADQLSQKPAPIQTKQAVGTNQTVSIAGQTKVALLFAILCLFFLKVRIGSDTPYLLILLYS